jgi:hypothetical protein
VSDNSIANGFVWATIFLAALIFCVGIFVVCKRMKPGWGPYTLQALGLVLLVPTVIVLGAIGVIDKEIIATLLGGIAGYIFGRGNEKPNPRTQQQNLNEPKK